VYHNYHIQHVIWNLLPRSSEMISHHTIANNCAKIVTIGLHLAIFSTANNTSWKIANVQINCNILSKIILALIQRDIIFDDLGRNWCDIVIYNCRIFLARFWFHVCWLWSYSIISCLYKAYFYSWAVFAWYRLNGLYINEVIKYTLSYLDQTSWHDMVTIKSSHNLYNVMINFVWVYYILPVLHSTLSTCKGHAESKPHMYHIHSL